MLTVKETFLNANVPPLKFEQHREIVIFASNYIILHINNIVERMSLHSHYFTKQ